ARGCNERTTYSTTCVPVLTGAQTGECTVRSMHAWRKLADIHDVWSGTISRAAPAEMVGTPPSRVSPTEHAQSSFRVKLCGLPSFHEEGPRNSSKTPTVVVAIARAVRGSRSGRRHAASGPGRQRDAGRQEAGEPRHRDERSARAQGGRQAARVVESVLSQRTGELVV